MWKQLFLMALLVCIFGVQPSTAYADIAHGQSWCNGLSNKVGDWGSGIFSDEDESGTSDELCRQNCIDDALDNDGDGVCPAGETAKIIMTSFTPTLLGYKCQVTYQCELIVRYDNRYSESIRVQHE